MRLISSNFERDGVIPDRHGLARPVVDGPVTLSANISPHLEWGDVPEGTRSFVIIVHDPDCPSRPDDVNQPDREVPSDLPRIDFFPSQSCRSQSKALQSQPPITGWEGYLRLVWRPTGRAVFAG